MKTQKNSDIQITERTEDKESMEFPGL